MAFALVNLAGLTSCSKLSDNDGLLVSPTAIEQENQSSDKSKANRIANWEDLGEMHNAILSHADDSLAVNFPNRFTTFEDYMEWLVEEIVYDYLVNTLEFSSLDVMVVCNEFLETDPQELFLTDQGFADIVYDMLTEELITQREANFINRWYDIRCQVVQTGMTAAVQADSMEAWKDDVLNITWNQAEVTIVPFMSVAYHSFDFWLNEGYDDTDTNYDGESVIEQWRNYEDKADLIDMAALAFAYANRDILGLTEDQCYWFSVLASAIYGYNEWMQNQFWVE